MWCGSSSKTDISWGENSSFFPANDPTFLAPVPTPPVPPSPPALLISEHYFVFFTLKTSLWCRPLQLSNRPNISFCDKDSTISLSTFMDAAVCAFGQTRSAVFAHLHLSCFNSTALPVDYLWVGPSGSSVPLRLPQTNHRPPFHWMLLTTKGWVLNYLWFFLANSVGNNSEQGNQGYI